MSGQPTAAAAPASLFGSIYNLGGSIVSYATDTLNSFLGWEDLDVVDPDAEGAEKGAKKADEGMNQNVSTDVFYLGPFSNGRAHLLTPQHGLTCPMCAPNPPTGA